jgi:hypothetical protein
MSKRTERRLTLAVAVTVTMAAWYVIVDPGSDEHLWGVQLYEFDAGYTPPPGTSRIARLGDAPIDKASPGRVVESKAEPGLRYVAVMGETGCRLPTYVELRRVGDDLEVRFLGGEDHDECYRPYTPFAQFAVPAEEVDGVSGVR